MTRDELIEVMARATCVSHGDDPNKLEPGNVFPLPWMDETDFRNAKYDSDPRMKVDGIYRGEPACFRWRLYVWQAAAALTAIEAAGLCIVPVEATEGMRNVLEHMDFESHTTANIYRAMIETGKF